MAFQHGRKSFFSIEDMSSTARDLSSFLRDISFPTTLDTPETTAFGSTSKSYVVGLKDSRISVSGMYDPTATTGPDEVLDAIFGEERPSSGASSALEGFGFVYGPYGETGVTYEGRAHLVNFQISGSVADMVGISADFQVTGAVTRNTP